MARRIRRGVRRLRVRADVYDPDSQGYVHVPGSIITIDLTSKAAVARAVRAVHGAIERVQHDLTLEHLDRAAHRSGVHSDHQPAD